MAKKAKQVVSKQPSKPFMTERELQLRILTELKVANRLLGELVSHFHPASEDMKYAEEVQNTKETYEELREEFYKELKRELE